MQQKNDERKTKGKEKQNLSIRKAFAVKPEKAKGRAPTNS